MMLEAFRHIQGEIRAAVHLNTDLHIRIFLPHLIQDAPWNITGFACIDCKYVVFLWLLPQPAQSSASNIMNRQQAAPLLYTFSVSCPFPLFPLQFSFVAGQ